MYADQCRAVAFDDWPQLIINSRHKHGNNSVDFAETEVKFDVVVGGGHSKHSECDVSTILRKTINPWFDQSGYNS